MSYARPYGDGRLYPEGGPLPRNPHTRSLDEPLGYGEMTRQRPKYWGEKPDGDRRGLDATSTSANDVRRKGIKKLSNRFVNKTSLQGLKFIEDATNWIARSFWILLFVGGLGASVYQLVGVFQTFFAYKVTTKIELGYSTLYFPSVTICNVNPLRYTMLDRSPEMKKYIDSLSTNWNDQPTQGQGEDNDQGQDQGHDQGQDQGQGRRRKRSLFPDFDGDDGYSGDYGYHNYVYDTNEAFGTQTSSDSYKMSAKFASLLRDIKPEDRTEMGYQSNLTILDCSFNGYTCTAADFGSLLTTEYGNCFTFNSNELRNESLKSRQAGLNHGLDLILYTGYRDYLPGYTSGTGFRVAIHPFKTMALPNQYSMGVSPGFESNIALKMVNISRKGSPHGDCTSTDIYDDQYGVTYTTSACSSTCIDRNIASRCNCMRTEYSQYYPKAYYGKMEPCKTEANHECVGTVRNDVENDRIDCDCQQPCKETTYEMTPSSISWPNTAVMGNMIDSVCTADDMGEDCEYLVSRTGLSGFNTYELLRENFARLKVYYQELNYETITEEAAYDPAQFGADIGGVVGLWLGMSVLSMFEVLHFGAQLLFHYCRRGVQAGSRHEYGDGFGRRHDTHLAHQRPVGQSALHPGYYPSWGR